MEIIPLHWRKKGVLKYILLIGIGGAVGGLGYWWLISRTDFLTGTAVLLMLTGTYITAKCECKLERLKGTLDKKVNPRQLDNSDGT